MKNLYFVFAIFLISICQAQNAADKDPSFNPFTVPENQYCNDYPVIKIMKFEDKLIVMTQTSISRLSNNLIDPTFNTGTGFVTAASSYLSDFVVQPDGKIIVVGGFISYNGISIRNIIRLNSDGSYDTSFALTGTGITSYSEHINLFSDGKILLSGGFTRYNGINVNSLARLNADGTLDTSFVSALNLESYTGTIARIQADNKVLVTKKAQSTSFINQLYRLNTDGTIDNTFTPSAIGNIGSFFDLTFQSDGKMIVVGPFITYNSTPANAIVRLNIDGTVDTSFVVGQGFSSDTPPYSIITLPDDKLIVAGQFLSYDGIPCGGIVRLNSNGAIDNTFAPIAGFSNYSNSRVSTLALQDDGKIVAGGNITYYDNFPINYIGRINIDGSRDDSFTNFGAGLDDSFSYSAMAIQSDDKIIIGGSFRNYNNIAVNQLMRLNADGSYDPTFHLTGSGFGGNISGYFWGGFNAIVQQPDGKILLGGTFISYNDVPVNRVIRLNNDGSLDNSFTVNEFFDGDVTKVILQPDGRIIVAGRFTGRIMRLNADGNRDITFLNTLAISGYSISIALQPDGKILLGGNISNTINSVTYNAMLRLNSNGSHDPSFHLNFTAVGADDITVLPDNKILFRLQPVASSFLQLKKINPDGSADTSFNYSMTGNLHFTNNYLMLDNGKYLICYFNFAIGQVLIGRRNADGSIDNSYDYSIEHGFNNEILNIRKQQDGKIVMVGRFTKFNNVTERRIIRLMGETSEELTIQDFAFDKFFAIYPNPTNDVLNINKKGIIEITTISIFNILGQQVITIPGNISSVDVSNLKAGNYFLRINSDKGISNAKFIKL